MKLTATAVVAAAFFIVALLCFVLAYLQNEGALVFGLVFLGIAAFIAIYSRVRGGAWFTDSSGGH